MVTVLLALSCNKEPEPKTSSISLSKDVVSGISLHGLPEGTIVVGETPSFNVTVSLSGRAALLFDVSDVSISSSDECLIVEDYGTGTAKVTATKRGVSSIRVSLGDVAKDFPVSISAKYHLEAKMVNAAVKPGVYLSADCPDGDSFIAWCSMSLRLSDVDGTAMSTGTFHFSKDATCVFDTEKLVSTTEFASVKGILEMTIEPSDTLVSVYAGRMVSENLVTLLSVKYPDGRLFPEEGYPEENFPGENGQNPSGGEDSPGDPENGSDEPTENQDTVKVRMRDKSLSLKFGDNTLYTHVYYSNVLVTRNGSVIGKDPVSVSLPAEMEISQNPVSGSLSVIFTAPGEYLVTIETSPDGGKTTYWNEVFLHAYGRSWLYLGLFKYNPDGSDDNDNVCVAFRFDCADPMRLKYSAKLKLTGKVFGQVSWVTICDEKISTLRGEDRVILARYPDLYALAKKYYLTKKMDVYITATPLSDNIETYLKVGSGIGSLVNVYNNDVSVYLNGSKILGEDSDWRKM